jgi:hypothetical protein
LTAIAVLGFAAMWLIGHFRYTSIGLDRETSIDNGRVQMDYYRIRWPGNGDFWIGGGGHSRPMTTQPLVPFDPASAFFINHHPVPKPVSTWNRWGWWYIATPATDPSDVPPGAPLVWGWWFGVPGWLPALILCIWPIRRWRRSYGRGQQIDVLHGE